MSIFDFVKDAGQRLKAAVDPEAPTEPDHTAKAGLTEEAPIRVTAGTLHMHLEETGLAPEDLSVSFRDGVATVRGTVSSATDREKILLALGNVAGVAQVDDRLTVEEEAREPVFYTVEPGDTLSKIAEQHYGDASKYPILFEANQPLLQDPNRIYPGQVLRIPDLGS